MVELRRGSLVAGRYELVDLLQRVGPDDADGPMEVVADPVDAVWRVWDRRSGGYLAARVMRHSIAGTLLRFVRERSSRLRHRHVVAPNGWAGEDDVVLFAMPLVRGGSVAELVTEQGRLPADWVAILLDQVLAGLVAAHDLDIVHGDVRASRLLLEATGLDRPHVRLSGFGLAAVTGDPSEDLSALGAVAAELLVGVAPAGVPPFSPDAEPGAPLGVPAQLWDVLARLTTAGSVDRPVTAREARAELAASGCLPGEWSAVADDAKVEVVDRLPPYPAGWGPRGPFTIAPPGGIGDRLPVSLDELSAEGDDDAEPEYESVLAGFRGERDDATDGADAWGEGEPAETLDDETEDVTDPRYAATPAPPAGEPGVYESGVDAPPDTRYPVDMPYGADRQAADADAEWDDRSHGGRADDGMAYAEGFEPGYERQLIDDPYEREDPYDRENPYELEDQHVSSLPDLSELEGRRQLRFGRGRRPRRTGEQSERLRSPSRVVVGLRSVIGGLRSRLADLSGIRRRIGRFEPTAGQVERMRVLGAYGVLIGVGFLLAAGVLFLLG